MKWRGWKQRAERTKPDTRPIELPSGGVVPSASFVVEGEFHRAEELRPDVVGVPSEEELDDKPHDPWRPSRTLGRINYR
jgi:hypothetical protein